jgi:hypothetical protein
VRFSDDAGVAGVFGFDVDGLLALPLGPGVVSAGGVLASGGVVCIAIVSAPMAEFRLSALDMVLSSFLEQAERDNARTTTSSSAPAVRIAFITTSSVEVWR